MITKDSRISPWHIRMQIGQGDDNPGIHIRRGCQVRKSHFEDTKQDSELVGLVVRREWIVCSLKGIGRGARNLVYDEGFWLYNRGGDPWRCRSSTRDYPPEGARTNKAHRPRTSVDTANGGGEAIGIQQGARNNTPCISYDEIPEVGNC